MSDHETSDRVLRLVCRKGAYEILRLLGTRRVATFEQIIRLHTPQPQRVLRALAAERFVATRGAGTWDLTPTPDSVFELTATGNELIGYLDRLDEWARECRAATATLPARPWHHLHRHT